MLSPYRIHPNNSKKRSKKASDTKKIDNKSHCEHNLKGPEITSFDLKRPQMTTNNPEVKPVKKEKQIERCCKNLN